MKWLEPSIQNRIHEINDIVNEEQKDLYNSFMSKAKDGNNIYELESLLNACSDIAVSTAYRKGLMDGIKLMFDIKKNLLETS